MERDQCQLKRAPYFMSSVRTWERLPNRRWMHWESRSKLWMRRSKLVSIQRNRWNVSMRKPKSNKNWKIKRRKPKDFRKNKKKKNVSRFQWWCILSLVSRCIWRVSKGISSFVIWLLWSPRISRLEQLRPIRQFHQLDFHRYHRYHQPVMDMEQCHLWALLVQLWIQELHWLRVIPSIYSAAHGTAVSASSSKVVSTLRRWDLFEKILYFEICSDVGIVFSLSQSRVSIAWSFGLPIGLKRKLSFESVLFRREVIVMWLLDLKQWRKVERHLDEIDFDCFFHACGSQLLKYRDAWI